MMVELVIPEMGWSKEVRRIGFNSTVSVEKNRDGTRSWFIYTLTGFMVDQMSEEEMMVLTHWLNERVARYAEVPPETAPGPVEARE